ncbi:M42 family metallopeptidase [Longirhabdus pacifica]|uniref:M42 family metallopeptidase n=1 Tax=Longirhabdus pacifica TaxID=2305227 RepID=UPI00197E5790|nr:M42 family metallopeptidase [Longirhabdus pacifica]
MDKQLFKTLTELPAVSGFERGLRRFVKQQMTPYADEIIQDALGGIFAVKKGAGPKIMVAGHLDEVGFMVSMITSNGMLKFKPIGGLWNQTLLAQRVRIVTDEGQIPGVIASVPPHLLSEAQRKAPLDIDNMLIDIGADNKEHVEQMGVRPGQQICFECPFTPLADPKKILAKAWDNRYGVGLALELLKEVHREPLPNSLYIGATVQEEVGLRGAEVAANMINPDLFFALDCSPANDTSSKGDVFGKLGEGTLLRILDRTMITHRGLVEYILDTAETHRVPYQYYISAGGTDAGKVHLHGNGVPSAVIGVCARYIHTSSAILHTDDYDAAKELLHHLVRSLDQTTFETIVENA